MDSNALDRELSDITNTQPSEDHEYQGPPDAFDIPEPMTEVSHEVFQPSLSSLPLFSIP